MLLALARYGGLRTPSEPFALRWADVNWARDRFRVIAPKTKHQDGGERWVPLFPELRSYLAEAFDLAGAGTEKVITRYQDPKQNLRTQFERIIARAGLKPWPRLFQNLRASRETELAEEFPIHVVAEWLGNSPKTALAHYTQVTEHHFERAAKSAAPALQKALQQPAATDRPKPQNIAEVESAYDVERETADRCGNLQDEEMTPTGFEPVSRP